MTERQKQIKQLEEIVNKGTIPENSLKIAKDKLAELKEKESEPAKEKKKVSIKPSPKSKKKAEPKKESSKDKYKGILGDYDKDGIPNADDPNPQKKGDTETVEEVLISDEIKHFIDTREKFNKIESDFVQTLKKDAKGAKVDSRVKTPFSIVNKLRRKRFLGPKGITDTVGTMAVFDNYDKLKSFVMQALKKYNVIDFDDYYASDNAGYKAYHLIINYKGTPIEIQAKTQRISEIAAANHDLYKKGKQEQVKLLALVELAEMADDGNKKAIQEYDKIKGNLREYLTDKKAPDVGEPKAKTPIKVENQQETYANDQSLQSAIKKLYRIKEGEQKADVKEIMKLASVIHANRKKKARKADANKTSKNNRLAPTANNVLRWAMHPGRYDLIGIDCMKTASSNVVARSVKKAKVFGILGIDPDKT